MFPDFDELPFDERPDLTPYLLHLTKNSREDDGRSAFDNLLNILRTGKVRGSSSRRGFVKGRVRAACLMDLPFFSLKYLLNSSNCDPRKPRYEPFGVFVSKPFAYKAGCRPVLYLSDSDLACLQIPDSELWRVVRFEVRGRRWLSWLHEREWRCKGDLALPRDPMGVVVKNTAFARKLEDELRRHNREYLCRPRCVLPLNIVCQGLHAL